ncbi:MAG: hypothetical protein JST86_07070 [Bacteroidetes bacterium]|nr:hypothetical protein [Bacteroidota bacterium]
MKWLIIIMLSFAGLVAHAQQYPNSDFKKWNEYGCPENWNCNNDADCKGKVAIADKTKGGVKLIVMHCFDPKRDERSNNVNLSYDDMSVKIPKGKKVKISFDYTYVPAGEDAAYIKLDADFDDLPDNVSPSFIYGANDKGILKSGSNIHVDCYLAYSVNLVKSFIAPQSLSAASLRTTFGIMPADNTTDVHKGTTLIIHHIKFELE